MLELKRSIFKDHYDFYKLNIEWSKTTTPDHAIGLRVDYEHDLELFTGQTNMNDEEIKKTRMNYN